MMGSHEIRKQKSSAYRFSNTRIALNYYSFYEMTRIHLQDYANAAPGTKEIADSFNRLLKEYLGNSLKEEEVADLRNRCIHQMEIITAYTDSFQIYEYVLNRLERRFITMPPEKLSIEDFTNLLIQALNSSEDNTIMNSQIQDIMTQLPIRYTRQKFCEMLMERFTVYIGSDKKSFEDLLYMLRTSSMILLPEDMSLGRENIYGLLTELKNADYKNMDSEHFNRCRECLKFASDQLNSESGIIMMLEDLINDLYVLCITHNDALIDSTEESNSRLILNGIIELFDNDSPYLPLARYAQIFDSMVGIQESSMEGFMYHSDEDSPEIDLLDKLLSGSQFASLEEPVVGDEADRDWINERGEKFCNELKDHLSSMSKPVSRAVMAKMFAYLPVMFRSMQEIRDYISGSLESCADLAEREACMQILRTELIDDAVVQ